MKHHKNKFDSQTFTASLYGDKVKKKNAPKDDSRTWSVKCPWWNNPCNEDNPTFKKGRSCPYCGLKEDGSYNV